MKLISLFTCIFLLFLRTAQPQYVLQDAFPSLPAFSYITEAVNSKDGTNRMFVVQQRGRVYVFPNNPSASNPKVFLDISDRVSQSGSETGLLGIAFHPNYQVNRYFYVNYTTQQAPLRTIVARYQTSPVNPDSALKSSELILLTVDQPYSNHNGGCLNFGPDNYLYISLGDGGSGGDPLNNAQNRAVLLGKILRINVDSASGGNNYSIPVTNPFYGNSQGWRQEIFTWGMRNTWKFSFDVPSGRIWAGDVGQNAWEEIDVLQSGKNYGWRIMEGFSCYNPPSGCDTTGLTKPLWVYDRNQGFSVTGGYVYRGPAHPALTGKYVYADYGTGRIWALTWDGINPPTNQLLYDSPYLISAFAVDQNNELYACSYGISSSRIYKLVPQTIGINNQSSVPADFKLSQNYPNPFNPATRISFSLSAPAHVLLSVFDPLGSEVSTLVNGYLQSGLHELEWDASEYPSGVYILRLSSGSSAASIKMVLIK